YVRIERRWSFDQVRRATLAVAREVERRAPEIATSKWWKEERHGVFIDYNQNAKDRTVASAWSVRPTPDARVSMPLEWDEVADCLVDSMRGRSSTWTRIRLNLRHVPERDRPVEEPPDPDYDPWRNFDPERRESRAPKTRSSS